MRQLRRLLSVLVMAVTMVGMSATAFAQEKDSGVGGLGSLTIANASKGVVYSVYKVFDAKVNADGTSVAYTRKNLVDNPYFEKDSAGNVFTKEEAYRPESKEQLLSLIHI
mgnify:FL=1